MILHEFIAVIVIIDVNIVIGSGAGYGIENVLLLAFYNIFGGLSAVHCLCSTSSFENARKLMLEIIFGSAEVRTLDGWVRSSNTSSKQTFHYIDHCLLPSSSSHSFIFFLLSVSSGVCSSSYSLSSFTFSSLELKLLESIL